MNYVFDLNLALISKQYKPVLIFYTMMENIPEKNFCSQNSIKFNSKSKEQHEWGDGGLDLRSNTTIDRKKAKASKQKYRE